MKQAGRHGKFAWVAIAVALVTVPSLSAPCLAQTASAQIKAETTQLRQLLTALKLSDNETSSLTAQLNLIDQAAQSGNLYFGINVLQRGWVELNTNEYAKSKAEVEKQGLAAFESEWLRLGQELDAKRRQLVSNAAMPAAVQVLIESSLTQVQPYYQSGRLYGRNTTIGAGLYYLGRAPANLDFALFCQHLKFPQSRAAPRLRNLDEQLEELEAATIKGFQDPANESKQSTFIQINSTLKMARELNAEQRYAGALKCYLDALLEFRAVNAAVPDLEARETLKKEAAGLRDRLVAAKSDQSIGVLYAEMALAAKSDAGLRRAAVIVAQILPDYLKLQGELKR
jgi:hypothetical protein